MFAQSFVDLDRVYVSILRMTVNVVLFANHYLPLVIRKGNYICLWALSHIEGSLYLDNRASLSLWNYILYASITTHLSFVHVSIVWWHPGGGGEGGHGEGEAGQQEDPVQPAAGSCGSALPHVEPQEHGEHHRHATTRPTWRSVSLNSVNTSDSSKKRPGVSW